MKKLVLPILLAFFTINAAAQVVHNNRIEIELKDGYLGESILEFGAEGFLIRSRKKKSENNNFEWRYELYDTDLQSEKMVTIMMPKAYYLGATFETDKASHSVFRTRKGDVELVTIEVPSMEITRVTAELPKKTRLTDMAILDEHALFIARMKKESFLMAVNWTTGKQNIIPIEIGSFSSKFISISNFQVLEESEEVLAYVTAYINKKESESYVVRLNNEGEKEDVFELKSSTGENFISVSASKIEDGHYVFSGTFSSRANRGSEGVFLLDRAGSTNNFITFNKFTDLDDFLSYLPQKKQDKIEKKKNKKEKKGKEFHVNYNIAEHDILAIEDGYLFLGEAYYPTYRTEYYTDSEGHSHSRTVFDGYQYTHAVIAKYSNDGELLWDKTFEMWPSYKPFYVKRFITVSEGDEGELDMVFANRSMIVSKSIDYEEGIIIEGKESQRIETGYSGDKAKYSFSNVDYWYENYFIAYGSQVIKNKEGNADKKKRKIFFVNKVEY